MPRRTCSVCNLPADVLAYGEKLILEGKEYREVAALAPNGPSKSSWHRHMAGCYRRRAFYGHGRPAKANTGRLLVVWGAAQKFFWDGAETTVGENDVIIRVIHEDTGVMRNAGRFAQDDVAELPAVEDADEPKPEIQVDNPQPEPPPAPGSDSPPAPPCQHTMVAIAANTKRCSACGFQENTWQPTGVSRADHMTRRDSSITSRLFPPGRRYRR